MFVWVLLCCVNAILAQDFSEKTPSCDYDHSVRTYFCKNIVDVFPDSYYGNFHLKCIHCDISTFSNRTFPFKNNLVSFNATNSNIKVITSNAFSKLANCQYVFLQNNEINEVQLGAFEGLRQVYELHLENNQIINLMPGFLDKTEVNTVDLSGNKIRELPNSAFQGASNLLTLDLSYNEIRKLNPDSFSNLDHLEVLNLEHNRICHLPLGLFRNLFNLKELNLANNKMSTLQTSTFSGLKNLNSLILANNTVSAFDGEFLLPFNHLMKIDITGNGIYYFDAYAIHLNAPTIRFLRIDDNLFSCNVLTNILQYFKRVNIEIVNTVRRYNVQNINGIACIDVAVKEKIDFKKFLYAAEQDAKKLVNYC